MSEIINEVAEKVAEPAVEVVAEKSSKFIPVAIGFVGGVVTTLMTQFGAKKIKQRSIAKQITMVEESPETENDSAEEVEC